ncbi:hypothetical protein [Deinococcus sedimenti]|uniref:Lipoprotein n=1 Tax=Deinococcus sedimenti TaxID=1867090 RepID=A0ABQ2SD97_9DEIO|nr:hypothetical protein [Deinococcus sedimenti]GGS10347.1 hypothetical protein GCM10008960_40610 [Deinococcus sedimenti]
MHPRPLAALALPLLLAACSVTAPPRDNAQWSSTLHGVTVTWRWTTPGELARRTGNPGTAGHASVLPGASSCVVDIDPSVSPGQLTRIAAHEFGHCLAAAKLRVFGDPQHPDPHTHQLFERWPEAYAQAYLRSCGQSRRPLGWTDRAEPQCSAPPTAEDIPTDW